MGRANGCTEYVCGRIALNVAFPANGVSCRNCNLCKREDGMRFRCMATMYLIYDLDGIQYGCPIEWEENDGKAEISAADGQ